MIFLAILLIYLIPSNIFLLFLINNKKINFINFIIAYGISPFINAILFYYLISLFDNRSNLFYILIISIFWLFLLSLKTKRLKELVTYYQRLFNKIKRCLKNKKILIFLFPLLFLIIYSLQVLFFPIVNNDYAIYLNESEAFYENKNIKWMTEDLVLIRGNDEYQHNKMVIPGIPSLIAYGFLIENDENYYSANFLFLYYYYLLFLLIIYLVYLLAGFYNKRKFPTIVWSIYLITFSSLLTRDYIFSAKELIIYFYCLLSIYLLYKLINNKNFINKEILLLSLCLGINTLINFHGIIITCIILFIYLLMSKLDWKKRIAQLFLIILSLNIFGIFQFAKFYLFIRIYKNICDFLFNFDFSKNVNNVNTISNNSKESGGIPYLDDGHQNLYNINNKKQLYLKGKLQLFFNIGVFGFPAWLFLIILLSKFKKIISQNLGAIIILFITLYFFIVLDPLNLNKVKFSIILWGSTKYAGLLYTCSLVIVGVFVNDMLKNIYKFICRHKNIFFYITSFILCLTILFQYKIISILTDILLNVVKQYKNYEFYFDKMNLFLYFIMFGIFLFLIIILLNKYYEKAAYKLFLILSLFIIISPFFVTNPGKISYQDNFKYLFSSRNEKLLNNYNQSHFLVYEKAKEIMPLNSILYTNLKTIYIYDEYFSLKMITRLNQEESGYFILRKDCKDKKEIFRNESIYLCKS